MKKLIIIIALMFAVIAQAQTPVGYQQVRGVPQVVEELRVTVLVLANQQRQHNLDQLAYVNGLPAGHISLVVASGERRVRSEWVTQAEAALAAIEERIAALEAFNP